MVLFNLNCVFSNYIHTYALGSVNKKVEQLPTCR